ncbi:hypothetical protein [Chelativorans sp. AA-79]|uniref:hypothetical protein n=1 Tax=Chelativorans sp. AA-79 TaxID=3028735 RepID=UPI0023F98562|nr:hypothetical protein [Chelativorans sp. AA-79]WEX10277.1 hypothetical protein PVE73_04780 [Chelativorans sp. AA-79]
MFAGALICAQYASAAQSDFSEQAARCWNLPSTLAEVAFVAEFDVALDGSGIVQDIAVISFSPSGEEFKKAILSASHAIELCAPYDVEEPSVVRFRMESASLFEGATIDPFEPLDR